MKEELKKYVDYMSDEQAEMLLKLVRTLSGHSSKHDLVELAGMSHHNYDTAYPAPYFRQIADLYPAAVGGTYIYDYTDDCVYGRLVNLNDEVWQNLKATFMS